MTESKYWTMVSIKNSWIEFENDASQMVLSVFSNGGCMIIPTNRVIGINNIAILIGMIQEAHDLAKAHFGSAWGATNEQ